MSRSPVSFCDAPGSASAQLFLQRARSVLDCNHGDLQYSATNNVRLVSISVR